MSDDEFQMDVDTDEIVPMTLNGKGKGKATEPAVEPDNLPW